MELYFAFRTNAETPHISGAIFQDRQGKQKTLVFESNEYVFDKGKRIMNMIWKGLHVFDGKEKRNLSNQKEWEEFADTHIYKRFKKAHVLPDKLLPSARSDNNYIIEEIVMADNRGILQT